MSEATVELIKLLLEQEDVEKAVMTACEIIEQIKNEQENANNDK